MKTKMNTRKLMGFFLAVMSVFLVATIVSAATTSLTDIGVEVDGQSVSSKLAVEAGETIEVKVFLLNPAFNATDLKVKAELQGTKVDVEEVSAPFAVEAGVRTYKTLNIKVPYELQDEVSDDLELNVKVWNSEFEDSEQITLRVMRPLYNADVMSISSSSTVEAGDTLAVDVVLKNIGYADLDDVYTTVRIPALGIERSAYFGDLESLETCEDGCEDNDAVRGKFYISVPYSAEAGIYALEVEVENDDLEVTKSKQILVTNAIPDQIIATSEVKKAGVNELAAYELVLVNPTSKVQVYNVVTENSGRIATSADNTIVVIPAGSSKTVTITAEADREGSYDFNVDFLTGNAVAESKTLTLEVEGTSFGSTNPVVILTIVLAVILLVLLVVLIVLLGKKSNKQDDFSESYY